MENKSTHAFFDKFEHFDTAMLVTTSTTGHMHSRPMAVVSQEAEGKILFVTHIEDTKVDEVLQNPMVNVSAQTSGLYLSACGTAEVIKDQALIEEIWNPAWSVWFPKGKADPSLTLLRIQPHMGEYWDARGKKALTFAYKAGKAFLTGKDMPDDAIDNKKVFFPQPKVPTTALAKMNSTKEDTGDEINHNPDVPKQAVEQLTFG